MTEIVRDAGERIGCWSVHELASRILARPKPAHTRHKLLANAAADLLRAIDCLTPTAEAQIDVLADGAEVVRIAHQPNLFPYEQLHGQTVYLYELASTLNAAGRPAVPIIFIVDYDDCGDKRTIKARSFDPQRTKEQLRFFSHRFPPASFPKGHQRVATFHAPAPDSVSRTAMEQELTGLARAFEVSPDHLIVNSGIHREARSLADFNIFSWANLAIRLWGLPVLFLRLSDIAVQVEAERRALARQLTGQNSELAGLWTICAGCGRRLPKLEACCPRGHYPWTAPQVFIDDLSDHLIYGISGGTSYEPAYHHLAASHAVGAALGFDLAPESCWRLPSTLLRKRPGFARANKDMAIKLFTKGHNSLLEHILDADRAAAFLVEMRELVAASHLAS